MKILGERLTNMTKIAIMNYADITTKARRGYIVFNDDSNAGAG
jgi:hypothetical protein